MCSALVCGHGQTFAQNYGAIISNHDSLIGRARTGHQDITSFGTFYGPTDGFKHGHRRGVSATSGHRRFEGYGADYSKYSPVFQS
jgi:hypothetical protein